MGCWQWKGNVTYKHPSGFLSMSTDVTWTRADQSQTPPSVTYTAEGKVNWVISGECTGSGSLPIAGFNTLSTYNFITAEGTFRRSYVGSGEETRLVGVVCKNGSGQTGLTAWMLSPLQPFVDGIPGARLLRVNGNGNVMDDSHELLAGAETGTWKWHMEAQRQP